MCLLNVSLHDYSCPQVTWTLRHFTAVRVRPDSGKCAPPSWVWRYVANGCSPIRWDGRWGRRWVQSTASVFAMLLLQWDQDCIAVPTLSCRMFFFLFPYCKDTKKWAQYKIKSFYFCCRMPVSSAKPNILNNNELCKLFKENVYRALVGWNQTLIDAELDFNSPSIRLWFMGKQSLFPSITSL